MSFSPSARDRVHLERCVELAGHALDAGDDPFGSVLVAADGGVLAEAVNRETTSNDPTAHPELELVRWAVAHLTDADRAETVVYTSGEHCPMCAAAHGWAGLGRVVFAASSAQLAEWRAGWGLAPGPVAVRPISEIAPGVPVDGPVPPYDRVMRELHDRARRRS
ncbi:tRNA(Arg) A34 adenosine deaminase TadA [Diaminobutyricimonas aerilata]|uniref:tRNA(Arg) A34 adenosine deaminase TadA n=1 Tax=Diaminobutyricimonas aerilata TaxID=1162967 RepID=A0A2M9CKY5_9MICO|nr:nucleoside deaminase [Diaminobutyricimonas aerilata]PJJ72550.1 tRNA(Arg) A34 adenosine deaminase TadA [Diaminobutyricimonas aerilata]